jgi:hypothetical protein
MIDLPPLLWSFRRALGAGCGSGLVVLLRRRGLGRTGFFGMFPLRRGLGYRHTRRGGSIGSFCSFRHQRSRCGQVSALRARSEARRLECVLRPGSRRVGAWAHPKSKRCGSCSSTFAGGTGARDGCEGWSTGWIGWRRGGGPVLVARERGSRPE